jgi:Ca2+-binding EF-hand superfamily protein
MVVDVYRHLLNRGPDPEGMKNAGIFVSMRGSASLVDQLVDSPEYRERFGDWTVPGSNVRYCAPGEQSSRQASSIARRENTMRFPGMDTNNDGVISRREWQGSPQAFNARDGNNDGVLSGDEVSVAVPRRGNRVGDGQDNVALDEDRFDYLDINGNGYIDRNEWDSGQSAFQRLDVNDDRRLSRGEFNGVGRAANSFASIDMDRDGRIRLNEWPWSRPAFDRQDANRDGVITQNEYRGAPAIRR